MFLPAIPRLRRFAWILRGLTILWVACVGVFGAGSVVPDRPFSPQLRTSDGDLVDPFLNEKAKAFVLIFVRPDCPISNRYATELAKLQTTFGKGDVVWWLVYADNDVDAGAIRQHKKEYQLDLPALLDPEHKLVRLAEARVTPEAAIFNRRKELVYHGRIDDRFVALGKARPEATRHDLQDALEDVLHGKPVRVTMTQAIGCSIPAQP
jgi:hypothetical protein